MSIQLRCKNQSTGMMCITFYMLLHRTVPSHCIGDITPLATDPLSLSAASTDPLPLLLAAIQMCDAY